MGALSVNKDAKVVILENNETPIQCPEVVSKAT
jgi:hypothetical protein